MSVDQDEWLDVVFAALADRTRRGLISQLVRGEATVGELAVPHAMTTQSVSQHLKVLEHAGLVTRTRVRQTRPCRLDPSALSSASDWIEQARAEWADRMDRLDAHLRRVQDAGPASR